MLGPLIFLNEDERNEAFDEPRPKPVDISNIVEVFVTTEVPCESVLRVLLNVMEDSMFHSLEWRSWVVTPDHPRVRNNVKNHPRKPGDGRRLQDLRLNVTYDMLLRYSVFLSYLPCSDR